MQKCKINIRSLNVRGLGSQHKRRDVIHFLKNKNADIIFLQDTHLTKEKTPSFNLLWKGKSYHSYYAHNSRGTSILISSHLHHDVISQFIDDNGNYIILQCKVGTEVYLLGSIYGPNRDEPAFYSHLDEIIDEIDFHHIIFGGDFNFVINAKIDSFGYVNKNNVNARKKFIRFCDEHN